MEENRGSGYKQFEIIDNRDEEPKSTKKEENETKKVDGTQKPLWVKSNKNDFDSLIQNVYNNLNNDEFKTTVDKKAFDLKNAKKFLVKITTQKISENYTLKPYSDLITPDITALEKSKSKGKDRRNNTLNVLKNLESVFTGVYLSYSDKPSESEESIAERTKSRSQRSDEIVKKENMIDTELFRKYFEYSSPSDMYNNLKKTIGSEENKAQVNAIKVKWAKLIKEFKSRLASDAKKIENRNNMMKIMECILEFNQLNQSGQDSKNTNNKPNAQ